MAGEDLKTQLVFGADASGAVAGVETTKKSLRTLGPAAAEAAKQTGEGLGKVGDDAKGAAAKVGAAEKNMIGSIQRQTAVLEAGSRTNSAYWLSLANQRGVDAAVLRPYLDQLDAVATKQKFAQAAIQSSAPVIDRVGVSAAQTANALRGIPAQFTDIAVSLQGGQAPLTVFLQQGGQLKDMFGGAGPAAKALGGYMLGLVSPFTVAAVAAGVLAYAYYQGSRESQEYAKAIILSGNAAGTTAAQLQDMAARISEGNRAITQGAAAAGLAALVQIGAVGAANLEKYAEASISFERVTGQAISKTADAFKELEKAPLEASLKLNDQIHYLTLTTYEHIKSLQEQGKYTDAARAAQDAYASALSTRASQITQNLGYIETAWRGVIDGAKKGWDAMLGVGRSQTGSEQLGALRKQLAEIEGERWKFSGGGQSGMEAYDKRSTALKAQISYIERLNSSLGAQATLEAESAKRVEARARWDKEGEQYLSNTEKRERAIAKVKAEGAAAGATEEQIRARIADINDKLKDPKVKAFADDGGTKYLETLRQQEAALREQLTSVGKMTDAEKELAKFAQLIVDLKGKDQLTADQKSMLASESKIRSQLEMNVGLEREVGFQKILTDDTKRRADALKATLATMDGIGRSMELAALQQREQYDDRLSVLGLGSQAAEEVRSREQIRRQYAGFDRRLTEEAAKNKELESDAYIKGTAQIKASLEAALDANSAYYAELKERQGSWSLGAQQALADYADESKNAYRQGERAASMAFGGIEDMMVNLRKTGKLSFRSIGDAFIDEMIRIETRAALSAVFGKGAGGGGGLGMFGSLLSLASGAIGGSAQAAFSQTSLGSSGFGSGLAYGNQDLGLSFDGGGYTGNGARSGGLDGKGGFMALMHPRETVVDHTKSGGGGWGAPTIINQTTGRVDQAEYRETPQGPTLTIREISAQLDNPNSELSRSMKRNINAPRRR